MALFPQLAETPRTSLLFNKRLNRNVIITIAALITISLWLFWRRGEPQPRIPPHVLWPEDHEPYRFTTTTEFNPVRMDPAKSTTEELCASFPRHMLESVQPVLKMGYSENRDKVEGQLNSSSACFQPGELLIFSDLDETLRGHDVIDILAYLPETYYNTTEYKKMEPYLLQKELKANGTLDNNKEAKKKIDGWAIDKFKFLPGVERAWAMKPNRDFYVFYETDTYIFWDNMFQFLQTLDPDSALYIGSPSPGRRDPDRGGQGTLFANGGPGYIFSRGAMKKMLHREVGPLGRYTTPQFSERHRHLANDEECCGDSILGYAAWLDGVILQGYYPLFTPYVLPGLLYDDPHWCQPLVTMHKTSPADMVELWKWEFANRKPRQPLLYKDIWGFFKPGGAAPNIIQNWDNEERHKYEPGPDAGKIASQQQCEDYCRSKEKCLQWVWRGRDDKKCVLMDVMHHGRKRESELIDEKWVDFTSGWMLDRIEKWREARPCTEVNWVGPSLRRIF